MKTISVQFIQRNDSLYRLASALALITVFYNLIEGGVSAYFGMEDETIALFGFGVDSFVEVISGIGIWHMVRRIRNTKDENPDRFQKNALIITGTSFFILAVALTITSLVNLSVGHKPETTIWGIIISSISIITMWILIHYKVKVGKELNSHAILADAACTRLCMQLSLILLLASLGYELTGIGGIDSIGALGIAWVSFKEGREAIQKAKGKKCSCDSCET